MKIRKRVVATSCVAFPGETCSSCANSVFSSLRGSDRCGSHSPAPSLNHLIVKFIEQDRRNFSPPAPLVIFSDR
jgi:hypothetical protein